MTDAEIERRYAGSRAMAGWMFAILAGCFAYAVAASAVPWLARREWVLSLPDLQLTIPWFLGWAVMSVPLPRIPPLPVRFPTMVGMIATAGVSGWWFRAWAKERRAIAQAKAAKIRPIDRDAARNLARPRSYARVRR